MSCVALDSMRREVNFMHNRDVDAYRRKQASSCLYVIGQMNKWLLHVSDRDFVLTVGHLIRVHMMQFGQLAKEGERHEEPESSFYFDSVRGGISSGYMPSMVVQLVSYERGRLRYSQLSGMPWESLFKDATLNRDICWDYLRLRFGEEMAMEWVVEAVRAESKIVERIDNRNGRKD